MEKYLSIHLIKKFLILKKSFNIYLTQREILKTKAELFLIHEVLILERFLISFRSTILTMLL